MAGNFCANPQTQGDETVALGPTGMFLLRPRTEPPMFLLQHRSLHPNLSVVLLQRVSRRMLPGAGRLVANGALYPSRPSGRSPSLPSGREVMPRRRAGVVEEPGRLLKTGRVCVASKPSTERLLKGPLRRRQIAPAQWKRPPWSSAPGDKSDEKLNPPCSFYCLQSAWYRSTGILLSRRLIGQASRSDVMIGWRPSDEHVGESLRRNDQTCQPSTTNPVGKITGFCSSRDSLTEGTDLPF